MRLFKKKEKRKKLRITEIVRDNYKNNKRSSLIVYFVLRILVVICMILQLIRGDINNALPLTYSEILTQVDKNKIYGSLGQAIFPIGYNFLIRYRIVCTDSLTVIPDTSSGWHAGPWASTTLSGDDINDTSSDKSDHEGYGDDKNKNGETDDINHTRTDYDDNQDAKDNINDKKNDKSSLDLDSAKEFINQIADVPKMIGDLFSFFPNWVKYTVELGFAFIFILIVYKLIRG